MRFVFGILILLTVLLAQDARAQSAVVPIPLQAELAIRMAAYDKALPKRARGVVKVAIYTRPKNDESRNIAERLKTAFSAAPSIAGMPHVEEIVDYVDAESVATACRTRGFTMVYFAPSFTSDMPAIARALTGVDVLTLSSVPDDAPLGAVVAFDLVGGKPKLLVHLEQSRKQGVQLSSDLLKLAKVVP